MRQSTLDALIVLIVRAAPRAEIERKAVSLGVIWDDVGLYLAEARRLISLAAAYSRDEQIGIALARLNTCYGAAIDAGELAVAVSAQRELNRLLGLHGTQPKAPGDEAEQSPEVQQSREYLAGLVPGGDDLPLPELCRIAAQQLASR